MSVTFISEEKEFMLRISIAKLAFLILLLAVTPAFAEQGSNITCIYFFYGEGCPHCGRVMPFISELESKYENIRIEKYEIYNNPENAALINKYFEFYNVPLAYRGVPVVFVGNTYIVGDTPILDNLERIISSGVYSGKGCPSAELGTKAIPIEGKAGISTLEPGEVSLWVLTGAAIADSINPCAIAVLLILLNALFAAGEKSRAVKAGFAFIISIYIMYFLFGIGLFSAIQFSGFSYFFYQLVALLAIVIGVFNIKDFLWYGAGGFVMEIPHSWRPTLKALLKRVTSPLGAFLIGFVVCLFELPCTGGPYIFILGLLAEKTTQLMAIPLLLYYNIIFVLPLIAINTAFYFGMSTIEKTKAWKERNVRLLHLIAGVIMVALGFWALLGFA